jgi:hypothetical protein
MKKWIGLVFLLFALWNPVIARPADDSKGIEIVEHSWRPVETWERIGKTRYVWIAKVHNGGERSRRVYVYYDLLNEKGVPLARNVVDRVVAPGATLEFRGDTYIETADLPFVKSSRATAKLWSR